MGCCGDREKLGELRAEQKWDYINLDEFKSKGCATPTSYGILYISLIISVAVYAVDTFTAVNLLAFDRWSGQIKPAIPLRISRWIFAGCIILSFVLLFYRWLRAVRVMRQGGVAQSYLDPLAVRIQSIRPGKNGRGWRRFLVFAELTRGKKGADYVALFTYFSFEAWLRVVFAEGPRQVVNALTLYSVMKLKLIPTGDHAATDGHTAIVQFFVNVEALAESNKEQAVILFAMLFTLVIWVISILNLAMAVLLYIFFLFHHIPSADGSLSKYCRRKINSRMERIVQAKVAKTLKKENAIRAKEESKKGDGKRQPTLPNLGIDSKEKMPEMPLLSRTTTQTTLPPYQSEPGSVSNFDLGLERTPTMPEMPGRPGIPTRTATQATTASNVSYSSNAPLMSSAGDMGYGGRPSSPGPGPMGYGARSQSPRPSSPASFSGRPMPPGRSLTGSTQASQHSYSGQRPPMPQQGSSRTMSGMSNSSMQSFRSQPPGSYQMGPIPRPGTAQSMGAPPSVGRRTPGPTPVDGRSTPFNSNNPYMNARMPPPGSSGRGTPGPVPGPGSQSGAPASNNGYMPFNPSMRPSTPQGGPQGNPHGPPRSMTQPNVSAPGNYNPSMRPAQYPPRSGTAPPPAQRHGSGDGGYEDILNSY